MGTVFRFAQTRNLFYKLLTPLNSSLSYLLSPSVLRWFFDANRSWAPPGQKLTAVRTTGFFMGGRAQHVINSGKEGNGRGREWEEALYSSFPLSFSFSFAFEFVNSALFDFI